MGIFGTLQRVTAGKRSPAERSGDAGSDTVPRRLLIVHDDPAVLDVAERAFSGDGYLPISTSTPQAALQIARSMRPLAVFVDVLMPSFDGWDVLVALKADPDTSDIPVLLLSMLGERGRAVDAGARGVVPKPLSAAKLRAAMGEVAQSSRR